MLTIGKLCVDSNVFAACEVLVLPFDKLRQTKKTSKLQIKFKNMGLGEDLFESAEEDAVAQGNCVKITESKEELKAQWEESELGSHDNLEIYCGAIGKIVDIDDGDNTMKLQWGNFDTAWIPIKACMVCILLSNVLKYNYGFNDL